MQRKTGRTAGETMRPAWRCGSGSPQHRNAQRSCFVHEVLRYARARVSNDALRKQVQQLVVTSERGRAAVAVPVRLADDLVDAVPLGPARRNPLDPPVRRRAPAPCRRTWRGPCRAARSPQPGRRHPCRPRWRPACLAACAPWSCGPSARAGSRGRRWRRR